MNAMTDALARAMDNVVDMQRRIRNNEEEMRRLSKENELLFDLTWRAERVRDTIVDEQQLRESQP